MNADNALNQTREKSAHVPRPPPFHRSFLSFSSLLSLPAFDATDPLKHGSIFGFHGSPLGNWHVIFRTGLKNATLIPNVGIRGTAHGPGIYFGYNQQLSWGYADAGANKWRHTVYDPSAPPMTQHLTMALAEIINRPEEFTTVNPYLVVPQEECVALPSLTLPPTFIFSHTTISISLFSFRNPNRFVMTRFYLVFPHAAKADVTGLHLLEPARALADRYAAGLM